jgi:hypothetical protein
MNSVLSAMAGGKVFSGDADSGVVVYCGGCSIKGRRPNQEDVLMVCPPVHCAPSYCVHQFSVV